MSKQTFEIIKMDAELSECPQTGVRYFGYVKVRQESTNSFYWHYQTSYNANLPWFLSVDELIESVTNSVDSENIECVLILKAEIPIKKLVM